MAAKVSSAYRGGARHVEYADGIEDQLRLIEVQFPRVRQVLAGWAWRLARDPEIGRPVILDLDTAETDDHLRVIRTPSTEESIPVLAIKYYYDDEWLEILTLRAFTPGLDPTF
jgi:hypothetical protein